MWLGSWEGIRVTQEGYRGDGHISPWKPSHSGWLEYHPQVILYLRREAVLLCGLPFEMAKPAHPLSPISSHETHDSEITQGSDRWLGNQTERVGGFCHFKRRVTRWYCLSTEIQYHLRVIFESPWVTRFPGADVPVTSISILGDSDSFPGIESHSWSLHCRYSTLSVYAPYHEAISVWTLNLFDYGRLKCTISYIVTHRSFLFDFSSCVKQFRSQACQKFHRTWKEQAMNVAKAWMRKNNKVSIDESVWNSIVQRVKPKLKGRLCYPTLKGT